MFLNVVEICKDNTGINCINVQHEKGSLSPTLTSNTRLVNRSSLRVATCRCDIKRGDAFTLPNRKEPAPRTDT